MTSQFFTKMEKAIENFEIGTSIQTPLPQK